MTWRERIATLRGHRVPRMNLIGRKKVWFAISAALIALSLFGLFVRGLNFSIEFEGGALLRYTNNTGATVGDIQSTLARFGRGESEVQVLGDDQVNIRTESLTGLGDRADQLRQALARQAGISTNEINEQDVSPTWGGTISRKALQGLVVFLVLVTLYISFRFELKMAAAALAALAHDLIITAGIYALVGREVTPATVIAILTIMGYSLYDTVVIFDKIQENTESPALVSRETYSGVANLSLNETFMRSVNTSLVVLLPIGALLLFGGETLKDFAFALFVGVALGAYSSIFLAAPVLALLKEREPRYRQIRSRAAARAARPGLRPVPAGDGAPTPATAAAAGGAGGQRRLQPAAVAPSGGTVSGADVDRPGQGVGSTAVGARAVTATKKKGRPQGKPKRRRR